MNRRRKRRLPFAAYAALIFNGALVATPFMAAHMITQVYGGDRQTYQTTPDAIAATREAMDERFQQIAVKDDTPPSEVLADLVRGALSETNQDIPRIRGLLLGAPAMLDGAEGDALRERIKVATGGGDEAALQAALTYLPGDLQDEYKVATRSKTSKYTAMASPASLPGAAATTAPAPAATPDASDDEPRVVMNRLGSLRQHSLAAIDWANDDPIDLEAFLLSGIGLILADPEEREGASIAMSTLRTKTQAPVPFKVYLAKRLRDVVPVDQMHKVLQAELHNALGYTPESQAAVERVFKTVVDREKLKPLLTEFKLLRDIASDTSFESAVSIVSRVKDGVDLRAATLVAAAGGDRAVALEHFDGDNLLTTARTVVPWTTTLQIQLAGVAACLALLAFVAMTTFWKSFRRNKPRKKSAVYLMEEHPA